MREPTNLLSLEGGRTPSSGSAAPSRNLSALRDAGRLAPTGTR